MPGALPDKPLDRGAAPSGVTADAMGTLPTGTVASTVWVLVSITETSLEPILLTYESRHRAKACGGRICFLL